MHKPELCHCGGELSAIYEQDTVRAYCRKCREQGPSKRDYQQACEAYRKRKNRKKSS